MTRRLVGSYTLSQHDMHQWSDDAIGLTGDWRKAGPVYALPFRTLIGQQNVNLLTAGRCISADTSVWDVTRVIPPCVVTGEAAGTAAALAVKQTQGNVHQLSIKTLQQQLKQQNNLLEPALAKPAGK